VFKHTLISQVLDIEHGDLDALLGQQVHDNLANTIAATRDNDDLAAPDIGIAGPIVDDAVAEPRADLGRQAKRERRLQVLERRRILPGKRAALGCVLGEQQQRQRQGRVKRRELEEASDRVPSDTWALG
jgi:hypothetical protein